MKYTYIKQHDITDCGAACLATISRHYGFRTSITRIRQISGTDKMGTNAYGMVKSAEQLGFTAKAVKGNKEYYTVSAGKDRFVLMHALQCRHTTLEPKV